MREDGRNENEGGSKEVIMVPGRKYLRILQRA